LSVPARESRSRAFRGGSWFNPAYESRSARRFRNFARDNSDSDLGLRPARPMRP